MTHQRLELSFINERIFGDEEIEMLVASVNVSFCADGDQLVKVMDVDVDKNSEQSRQDLLARGCEVVGKGDVHSHWKE